MTPLDEAIKQGHVDTALILLEGKDDVAQEDIVRALDLALLQLKARPDRYPTSRQSQKTRDDLHRLISKIVELDPEILVIPNALSGNLPIHYAVRNLPIHFADSHCLETIQFLMEKSPSSLGVPGENGKLPLHLVFEREVASPVKSFEREVASPVKIASLIGLLLKTYKYAVKVKDAKGCLPLHIAMVNHRKLEESSILDLCNMYPEGAEIKNNAGAAPLHIYLDNAPAEVFGVELFKALLGKSPASLLSMHYACKNGTRVDIAKMLLAAYPEGAMQQDETGKLPIHVLAPERYGSSHNVVGLLNLLFEKHPEGIKHRDKKGRLPLHYASGDIRFECVKLVLRLYQAYPGGIKQVDDEGQLPIHKSMRFGHRSISRNLIREYPEGLFHKDKHGRLPIFYCSDPDDELFNLLVTEYPQCLKQDVDFQLFRRYLTCKGIAKCRQPILINFAKAVAGLSATESTSGTAAAESASSREVLGEIKQQLVQQLEELKTSHQQQLDELKVSREQIEAEKRLLMQQLEEHKAAHEQLTQSQKLYKDLATKGRAAEKVLLARMLDPETADSFSIEEMKSFASSLKGKIDMVKASTTPEAKPSIMQIVFSVFLNSPDLSRASLLACIGSLDSELTGLESALEADATPQVSGTSDAASSPSGRPAKRTRVSP